MTRRNHGQSAKVYGSNGSMWSRKKKDIDHRRVGYLLHRYWTWPIEIVELPLLNECSIHICLYIHNNNNNSNNNIIVIIIYYYIYIYTHGCVSLPEGHWHPELPMFKFPRGSGDEARNEVQKKGQDSKDLAAMRTMMSSLGRNSFGPVTGRPSIIIYLLKKGKQSPLFSSTNQWEFGTSVWWEWLGDQGE